MIFETERLSVRNLKLADLGPFHEMQSDDQVMKYTTGHGFDEAENQKQLQQCIDCYARPENEFWVWAIEQKTGNQFVGTCAIVPHESRPEIGYRFLRKYFGLGFGQEICDGLIEHAISVMNVPEIVAFADLRNVASVKILDRSKLPFVEEVRNDDGFQDRFYHWQRD